MSFSIKNPGRPALKGAAIFAAIAAAAVTALWVRHKADRAERDNPPLGNFIVVDNVRLHYVETGEGPPVVLLHGNTVLLQDYMESGLVAMLSRRHRVIVVDRPGFGYSERPRNRLWTAQSQARLLHKAMVMLGVNRPVVVAHSWATLVALGMAVDFPADVRGLMLVSGYYYPSLRVDVALAAPVALPVLGDAMRYTVSPLAARLLLRQAVRKMFAPKPMPAGFFDVVPREMLLRPSQLRATAEDAALMIPAARTLRDRYSGLEVPVTIVAGDEDKIVDVRSHAVRLHRELSDSTLVVVPGAGHMVHHVAQPEIAEAVRAMSDGPALLRHIAKTTNGVSES